jgi:hypothetical protein
MQCFDIRRLYDLIVIFYFTVKGTVLQNVVAVSGQYSGPPQNPANQGNGFSSRAPLFEKS